MKKLATLLIISLQFTQTGISNAQIGSNSYIDSLANVPAVVEEFNSLLLCHCSEHIEIKKYTNKFYLASKGLKMYGGFIFGPYLSGRLNTTKHYYQEKYDQSLFFQKGVSTYYEKVFNFQHLDSLYFDPMVKYYIRQQSRDPVCKDDLGSPNLFFDCYLRLKEIPIKEELKDFLYLNKDVILKGDIEK